MCTAAGYFWDGDALSTSRLISIISVLEAQILELNCCSSDPSYSSTFSTASYESYSSPGTGDTLQKSAGALQCKYTARRSSVSYSEMIWASIKSSNMRTVDSLGKASVPPSHRNGIKGQSTSGL